ncbi:unnamed protein product [Callosobruchus maculatus]|uniref:Uncharacterized protein n=1 Tax=Callosobruchus maculatus TaxID=64391 RepID=A0A653BGQ3_CALMS|nr:unnamed protein product [Callosobruchus maculatus]
MIVMLSIYDPNLGLVDQDHMLHCVVLKRLIELLVLAEKQQLGLYV